MTPLKPYLIRAINEWIVDNDYTPHLLVDANYRNTVVPRQFVEDGKIVLNIRPQAVQGLSLGNDDILFNARFSGTPMRIVVPVAAVLAIYAKENGKGMVFEPEEDSHNEPPERKPPSRPHLRVVK